ncbi:MAG TPA: phosphotransferase, partial [Mycobacterium sp.]|nr:phosphotransferase [Mycobacterium sp.]
MAQAETQQASDARPGESPARAGGQLLLRRVALSILGSSAADLAAATEWLRDNIYEPEHLCLCWGDSRLSNILYGPKFEVAAVVDWEIAYIGDHEADLAWLLFTDWGLSEYQGLPRLDG